MLSEEISLPCAQALLAGTLALMSAYAAPVSALSLNENVVWIVARPENGRAVVELDPASTAIPVNTSASLSRTPEASIDTMRAEAWGERTVVPWKHPFSGRSSR